MSRIPVKRNALAILDFVGFLRAARTLQRGRAVVLTYHGVLTGDRDDDSYLNYNFVAAGTFERQIRFLLQHYRPIRLSDLVRRYVANQLPPPRSVALTFDDGFANNYSVAFPVLQKYGFPFTVFLTTGLLDKPGAQLWTERVKRAIFLCASDSAVLRTPGREIPCRLDSPAARELSVRRVLQILKRTPPPQRDAAVAAIESACGRPELKPHERERYEFLTWPQVRAMASAGVEFGSHTVTHPILATLDDDRLREELAASKQRIETETGQDCYALAYPNGQAGDFGPREKRAVKSAGYSCAFSLGGSLNPAQPDLFQLDRVNIGRQFEGPVYAAAVAGFLGGLRMARRRLLHPVRSSVPRQVRP